MVRRWRAFDVRTINREMLELPQGDFQRLTVAMKAYRMDVGAGYTVKSYGEGLMMVRDDSHAQGRCLFFAVRIQDGEEVLTALLIYKKESDDPPKRILKTARDRMRDSQ